MSQMEALADLITAARTSAPDAVDRLFRATCRTARRSDTRLPSSLSRVTPFAVSEHLPELLGCPISAPSLRFASILNQGPFPSPALPGFSGTTNLSVTPLRPCHPSRASGCSSLNTPWGFPCCVRFPLCTCCRHYPGAATGFLLCSIPQPYQPSPKGLPGRSAHRHFRGLLSVHSRCGLHTRAVTNS
jgi:hypothetical protein